MHLVDRDRLAQPVPRAATLEPALIAPAVVRARDDRRRLWRMLGLEGERIRPQQQRSVVGADLELVACADPRAGDEQLPHARAAQRAHLVQAPVPAVEVPDDAHRPRARRPHGEARARRAGDLAHVCAKPLVEQLVPALGD